MQGVIGIIIIIAIVAGLVCCGFGAMVYLKLLIVSAKNDRQLSDLKVSKIELESADSAVKVIAEATVGKLEEIIAKELRVEIENGEAKKEELYALSEAAYEEIVSMLKPDLLETLSGSIQDVDLHIRNQIENQLLLLKAKLNGGAKVE